MKFIVVPNSFANPERAPRTFYLYPSNWNDWYVYQTRYSLQYVDSDLILHEIGGVKIAQKGMGAGAALGESDEQNFRKPKIPEEFNELSEEFFSLGQDSRYYNNLNKLGEMERINALTSLRDIAHIAGLIESVEHERVLANSLMRDVSHETIIGQFRRISNGGARLTEYRFMYTRTESDEVIGGGLEFRVTPSSTPPTNVHVIIGRNGVGKTRLLDSISRTLVSADQSGFIRFQNDNPLDEAEFSKVVSVSFSAFDSLDPVTPKADKNYAYVGLKRQNTGKIDAPPLTKSPSTLTREFTTSVVECLQSPTRLNRWKTALRQLEADPVFAELEVSRLADISVEHDFNDAENANKKFRLTARNMYHRLSSGHKIVLLTMTRLVELVEEKTLVLLDEPESHLHPPLLSAFIRALSDLLIDQNGVSIIATHSPVVLQEVPSECAWIMQTSLGGGMTRASRPNVETFGENVSILTHEVFGLEVTKSGFHKMLYEAVLQGGDYETILSGFSGRLGGEARSILRGLVATRDNG